MPITDVDRLPGRDGVAARHWVFLDLLLTSATYRDALTASKERRIAAAAR